MGAVIRNRLWIVLAARSKRLADVSFEDAEAVTPREGDLPLQNHLVYKLILQNVILLGLF